MSLDNTTKHPKQFKDRSGQRFGRLLVIEEAERPANCHAPKIYWRCRCDCGNVVVVDVDSLRQGNTKSCGCLRKEVIAQAGGKRRTHGMTRSPEYRAWIGMKVRCYVPTNKDYAQWGGRGITVCERWRESFEAFYQDMGPRPGPRYSIDRIDNNGPYSPENCRWATYSEQNYNQRPARPPAKFPRYTFDGKTLTLAQWARETNIPYRALAKRIYRGWSIEKAINTPMHSKPSA